MSVRRCKRYIIIFFHNLWLNQKQKNSTLLENSIENCRKGKFFILGIFAIFLQHYFFTTWCNVMKMSWYIYNGLKYLHDTTFNTYPNLIHWDLGCEVYDVQRHFQEYFSYIMANSFTGGGSGVTGENHPRQMPKWKENDKNTNNCGQNITQKDKDSAPPPSL
jgi:hypothetical protein